VLVPFVCGGWQYRPAKLIYVLPLRTLAESIYREARELFTRVNRDPQRVTLQTGEQPDDPFFTIGDVIVATYDQLLSGLLESPYGLPDRLHNINAAAVAGALVVFDEFHLMEPRRAFLTSAAMLKLFTSLCQSVWMTATATVPLVSELEHSLGAKALPRDETSWTDLLNELPAVNSVERVLQVRSEEVLTGGAVASTHNQTSIVIANTVNRAQQLYRELERERGAGRLDAELLLLHARFLKSDRAAKEARLRALFGPSPKQSTVLVATQVVEAGLDISCENLHTEVCPMNALVQRAGRCARFPGQHGTVHVYALPNEPRPWLPYGTLQGPDETLTRTQLLLAQAGQVHLDPRVASEWVQAVHSEPDERALSEGVESRVLKCKDIIETRAIHRQPAGVSDLIREPDTDQVRTLICYADDLPRSPAEREALNVNRWQLIELANQRPDIGWWWDWTKIDEPWTPVTRPEELRSADIVCLNPMVANYDPESGLHLGEPGTRVGSRREVPPRPGYAPLASEPWTAHALNVATHSRSRIETEARDGSLLGQGLADRYALSFRQIAEAAVAAGLLHDLGKLQAAWQAWAEAAQRSKDPNYVHAVPLAHTDFDRGNPDDVRRERELTVKRPRHAPASCYYGLTLIGKLLPSIEESSTRAVVASAVLAAVVAHHGGWWNPNQFVEAPQMWPGWENCVTEACRLAPPAQVDARPTREAAGKLLRLSTGPDVLFTYWPLVAFLMRTLRLADQRATAEVGSDE
jgi:CRISPR-associated endonuclease/helicase Cas3